MKKIIYLFVCTLLFPLSCQSQSGNKKSSYTPINFLEYAKGKYISLLSTEVKNDSNTREYEVTIPYYELYVEDIKIGKASLFAIAKELPEKWIKEALENPKGKCNQKGDYYPSFYIRCEAERLFTEDTATLKDNFDLYVFLIKKEELDGPFIEEAEGGKVYSYYPIKGSTFIIYKYENGHWKEINRVKQEGDEIPRSFGMDYMEQLASERVKRYLEDR